MPVVGGLAFTKIYASGHHTCALSAAGSAYCWGYNHHGEFGNNDSTGTLAPVAAGGGLSFRSLGNGLGSHVCGITLAGILYCWGANNQGQLGAGFAASGLAPMRVTGQP
jgi:alpha-tubulin suppressor-like RCC1 family protein